MRVLADGSSWRLVRVGMYDAHEGAASINDSRIEWRGADRRRVPGDRSKWLETLVEVSAPLYVCMCAIAALGMFVACTLICVNLRFRNHRYATRADSLHSTDHIGSVSSRSAMRALRCQLPAGIAQVLITCPLA